MTENNCGKIYITGDKHGSLRFLFGFFEKKLMRPEDILIITGDAGYVWDEDYQTKIGTIEQLFPGTLCFIDGNHENHKILNRLPIEIWKKGRVHRIGNRVIHLMRGEIYEIYGKRFFCFGGARTVSRYVEGVEGVDAVTSATLNKPRTGTLAGGSYHVDPAGSDITGVIYPVKVNAADLAGKTQITDSSKAEITVSTDADADKVNSLSDVFSKDLPLSVRVGDRE